MPNEPSQNTLTLSDGTPLALYEWPMPGAPAGDVFLLHGMGEHALRWEPLAHLLGARGYRVRGWDMRGHGSSGGKRGDSISAERVLGDLEEVFGHLELNPERRYVYIIGHSVGGMLALLLAGRAHALASGYVAISPFLGAGPGIARWKVVFAPLLARLLPWVSLSNDVEPETISRLGEEVEAYREDPLTHDRISARFGASVLAQAKKLQQDPPPLNNPVLLLQGGADPVAPPELARQFAERAKGPVEYVEREGVYHDPRYDLGQGEVFKRIADWLDSLYERQSGGS